MIGSNSFTFIFLRQYIGFGPQKKKNILGLNIMYEKKGKKVLEEFYLAWMIKENGKKENREKRKVKKKENVFILNYFFILYNII